MDPLEVCASPTVASAYHLHSTQIVKFSATAEEAFPLNFLEPLNAEPRI
jgi:hypothetical protein